MASSMLFKTLSLLLLLNGADAMSVKVESYECKEDAMTVTFNKICNEQDTCTMGQEAYLEGYLTYYGMVDQYGLGDNAEVYVDFSMAIGPQQEGAEQAQMVQEVYALEPFSLCDYRLAANDNDVQCPYSGRYKFNTNINLPSVGNSFKDWAYSGYEGVGVVSVYLQNSYDSTQLAYCTMELSTNTAQDGIYSKAPTGKVTLIAILSTVAVLMLLAICACLCACNNNKHGSTYKVAHATQRALDFAKEKVGRTTKTTGSSEFKLMEDATENPAKKNWKLDWDSKACTGKHAAEVNV